MGPSDEVPPPAPPEDVDLLLLHGTVLTCDAHDRQLDDGGVAIRGDEIVAVGPSDALKRRFRSRSTLDCRHQAILPGLIDTYTHAGHGLVRGLFDGRDGPAFGQLYWHATTPAWWHAEARLAALERTRFGVTTAVAIVGATPPRVDETRYALQVAEANAEAGTRVVIGVGPPDPLFPHLPEPWRATRIEGDREHEIHFDYDDALEVSLDVIRDVHGGADGRVRACLAPPYLFGRHVPHRRIAQAVPTPDDAPAIGRRAERLREHADSLGVPLHTHMFTGSVAYAEKHLGFAFLVDVLGPDVVVAHANGMSAREIEILGERACAIAAVPTTHENLWYGVAPLVALRASGATVTVTTDGAAPYCSLDLLSTLASATWNEWRAHDDQSVFPAETALRAVTIDAARALGLEDELGSLEPGKKADVITVDLRAPHLTPMTSLPFQLVHHASGHDVHTVVVGGTLLKDGADLHRLDSADVLKRADEEARRALERWKDSPHNAAG